MHSGQHYLTPLLDPASIAIVGASEREGSVGAVLARNMLDANYRGELHFVNPGHQTLFGKPCLASVADIPHHIDLAVICTRRRHYPAILDACGRAGTRSALIVTGGKPTAEQLDAELLQKARRHGLRLLGPDSLGLMRPDSGINLTFTRNTISAGGIGLISQSKALCAAVLDWAQTSRIGVSSAISLDDRGDVEFGEVLDYLATDPQTQSIFLHIERIHDARRFMSALRAAACSKPVLLLKVGEQTDDAVFDAALQRAGVVRLNTTSQMRATAQALLARFRPRGNRLAILGNGAGPALMAADRARTLGIPLASFEAATQTRLQASRPHGAIGNPLDIGDDAGPERYAEILDICRNDANVDGILAILTPQMPADPSQTARLLIERMHSSSKPLIACWMGAAQVDDAHRLFQGAGIPHFRTPEPAVDLFAHLGRYYRNQQLLLQAPSASTPDAAATGDSEHRLATARHSIDTALREHRTTLSVPETAALLTTFDISSTPNAGSQDSHELVIRLYRDATFGPVIALGPKHHDRLFAPSRPAVTLPPLNRFLIDDLLQNAGIDLHAIAPAGMAALENLLLKISAMACELPWLREMDIDPLHLDNQGVELAIGHVRIDIAPASQTAGRYDHMAIHPYPIHLLTRFASPDGQTVLIRPIRPEDATLEQAFIRSLSPESRYFRFMNAVQELPPAQLARLTQIDYDRDMAFVAMLSTGQKESPENQEQMIGIARYAANPDGASCEFAIVVADHWQGTGLARRLMEHLIDTARTHAGLKAMTGDILVDNQRMLDFIVRLGFSVAPHPEDNRLKRGVLTLDDCLAK